MKQFTVEEYQKNPNRKVITRDGKSVRIVYTDMIGTSYPVLAICRVNPTPTVIIPIHSMENIILV